MLIKCFVSQTTLWRFNQDPDFNLAVTVFFKVRSRHSWETNSYACFRRHYKKNKLIPLSVNTYVHHTVFLRHDFSIYIDRHWTILQNLLNYHFCFLNWVPTIWTNRVQILHTSISWAGCGGEGWEDKELQTNSCTPSNVWVPDLHQVNRLL